MAEKNTKNKTTLKKEEEKIYFSTENFACFACGEKIEKNTGTCPYCGTSLNKTNSNASL